MATGAKRGKVRFEATGGVQSAVTGSGNAEVECVALDEVLEPSASIYIKWTLKVVKQKPCAARLIPYGNHAPLWQYASTITSSICGVSLLSSHPYLTTTDSSYGDMPRVVGKRSVTQCPWIGCLPLAGKCGLYENESCLPIASLRRVWRHGSALALPAEILLILRRPAGGLRCRGLHPRGFCFADHLPTSPPSTGITARCPSSSTTTKAGRNRPMTWPSSRR